VDCFVAFAPLRKRFAFVAGNDEENSLMNHPLRSFLSALTLILALEPSLACLRPRPRRSTSGSSPSTISTAISARRRAGFKLPIPATKTKKIAVPAGGSEAMATLVRAVARGARTTRSLSRPADLIGASPLLSAMFHDEPTIESMSMMGLELSAGRQSRIRRGQGRAAADAERWLPSR